jgi:hypothetical protein
VRNIDQNIFSPIGNLSGSGDIGNAIVITVNPFQELTTRAQQFGLVLDDISITHLTFGR